MSPALRFEAGDKALLLDARGRKYLVVLSTGGTFHFHRGIVAHDDVIGEQDGGFVRSSGGEEIRVFRPTLSEFVLKMTRGAQVVYPKDIGMIMMVGDLYPGATVVEAGAGSGALTIGLLRAVGPEGRVVSYELREEFASTARANVESFLGKAENWEIRMQSIYDRIEESGVDRVILDVPEPWKALEPAARSLRSGGILVSYLPTVLQVQRLGESIAGDDRWGPSSTTETLVRSWKVEGQVVRPDHRMVAHTGFLTSARRILPA